MFLSALTQELHTTDQLFLPIKKLTKQVNTFSLCYHSKRLRIDIKVIHKVL